MYATEIDMLDYFSDNEVVQLKSVHEDGEAALARALKSATEEIDSYITQKYADEMPFDYTPSRLTQLCCDIARYNLYTTQATEEVQKRYDDAIKWLNKVADGKAVLVLADKTKVASSDDEREANTVPISMKIGNAAFTDDVLAKMPSVR